MAIVRGYPAPRERAAAGTAAAAGAPPPAVPTVRLWPFSLREQSGVCIAVSPLFSGPGVIDAMVAQMDIGVVTTLPTFSLYVSSDENNEGNNQALGTEPSGTRIFDTTENLRDDAFPITDTRGWPGFSVTAGAGIGPWRIGYPVTLARFTVKLRIQNTNAVNTSLMGYIRVLENIPPDQLANFL